jgi:hypothetical protein
MAETPSRPKPPGINRRRFIGAMGAAAGAGAFLTRSRPATAEAAQTYYYQDSFGNIAPAGQGAIALRVYPPPIPVTAGLPADAANPATCGSGANGTTYYTCGYPQYNILLISSSIRCEIRDSGYPAGAMGRMRSTPSCRTYPVWRMDPSPSPTTGSPPPYARPPALACSLAYTRSRPACSQTGRLGPPATPPCRRRCCLTILVGRSVTTCQDSPPSATYFPNHWASETTARTKSLMIAPGSENAGTAPVVGSTVVKSVRSTTASPRIILLG